MQQKEAGKFSACCRWHDPRFGTAAKVNQQAQFQPNYHKLMYLQQLQSDVIQPHKTYSLRKSVQVAPKAQEAHNHRRINVLSREQKQGLDGHCKDGLFDLGKRIQPISQEKRTRPQTNTVVARIEDGLDYHHKRFAQNMQSTLDQHDYYKPIIATPSAPPISFTETEVVNTIPQTKAKVVKCQKPPTAVPKTSKFKRNEELPRQQQQKENKCRKKLIVEVKSGWGLVNLQLLSKVLGGKAELLQMKKGKEFDQGMLSLQCGGQEVTGLLRALKQEGVTAYRR